MGVREAWVGEYTDPCHWGWAVVGGGVIAVTALEFGDVAICQRLGQRWVLTRRRCGLRIPING